MKSEKKILSLKVKPVKVSNFYETAGVAVLHYLLEQTGSSFCASHHQFEHFGLEKQEVVSKLGNSLRLVFFCFCIQN